MQSEKNKENLEDLTVRLQSILDTAVDGIVTIDEHGIIEYANNATTKTFGYSQQELIGERIEILMPEPYRSSHGKYMRNYKETGEAKIIGIGREIIGQKKDGSTFPFHLSVSEVNLKDRKVFTGMIHDLTPQKEAEEHIKRLNLELENKISERTQELLKVVKTLENEAVIRKETERMLLHREADLEQALDKERELNQLKTRFVSMASHEFRTPLSTILSSASLMTSYTQTEQQSKRERHFEKIKSAIDQLTNLLNDFLSISKLEEGKIENNPEWFDLKSFIEVCIEDISGLFKPNQTIELEGFNEKNYQVHLDKKLMKIVFNNLFSNAIKYSEPDKTIFCQFDVESTQFSLKIIDQGIGIPIEDQLHLFDRFFRAHNATNIQGTGLGLYIVKKHLELMNGSIEYISEESRGSVFKINFPIAKLNV